MMRTQFQGLTLEELEKKKASILSSCSGWRHSQDGSYEMALHYAGFDDVCDEIKRRNSEERK